MLFSQIYQTMAAMAAVLLLSSQGICQNVSDEALYRSPNEVYYPAAYCGWNRLNLPEKHRAICKKYDDKIAQIAERVHKNPSQNLIAYESAMRPYVRAEQIAFYASVCSLRSTRYFVFFRDAHFSARKIFQNKYPLDHEEKIAGEEAIQDIYRQTLGLFNAPSHKERCDNLTRSNLLREADELERTISNNYH